MCSFTMFKLIIKHFYPNNLNLVPMKTTLNYSFKRQSKNHLDWLIYIIKSERCHEIESSIVNYNSNVLLD